MTRSEKGMKLWNPVSIFRPTAPNVKSVQSLSSARRLVPAEQPGGDHKAQSKTEKHQSSSDIKHNSLTKCIKNARTFITSYLQANATNHKTTGWFLCQATTEKKARALVFCFFFLVLCSCFITQTKSFINALSWSLKGIIPVMNYTPCGFNCAHAPWSTDLVKNHCVDGKFYLEKQKKVCKWKAWRQKHHNIFTQCCSLSSKSRFLTRHVCLHTCKT